MKRYKFSFLFKTSIVVLLLFGYLLYPDKVISFGRLVFHPFNLISDGIASWFNVIDRDEYDRLLVQVNNQEEKKDDTKIVRVLRNPPLSSYDSLIVLNEDNILVEGPVYTIGGEWIGYIDSSSIDKFEAKVITYTTPGYETEVSIKDFVTTSKGIGGGGILITIPKSFDIQKGDKVFSQKFGSHIATVVSIKESRSELKIDVEAKSVVNLNNISSITQENN